jgi:hypothetical protein
MKRRRIKILTGWQETISKLHHNQISKPHHSRTPLRAFRFNSAPLREKAFLAKAQIKAKGAKKIRSARF